MNTEKQPPKYLWIDKMSTSDAIKAMLKNQAESFNAVEKILGRKEKFANSSELENSFLVRKSIVASKNIKKGELLSSSNLTTKRPGKGLSPMLWYEIIGKKASKNYKIDEFIIDEN